MNLGALMVTEAREVDAFMQGHENREGKRIKDKTLENNNQGTGKENSSLEGKTGQTIRDESRT